MEVAARLFEKFGYDKTSIDDIAKLSHKAKGSIYYNFKGKLDIYKSIVVQELAQIKSGLVKVCQRFTQKEEGADQVIQYLLQRMELIDRASLYKQMLTTQYLDSNHAIVRETQSIRADFDKWEWNYFVRICEEWTTAEVLNSSIRPESFADMLQMILKGLELQFFAKNDYANSKPTYENMIIIILNTMAGGESRNNIGRRIKK